MKYIGIEFNPKVYNLFMNYTETCFFCIPYENIYIASEKPVSIKWKDGRLHSSDSPSVLFKDGYGLYSLNGVRVTKEIVETPANKLDPELAIKEKNAEVRREIIKKIGVERLCQKLHAKVIDKWKDYELLDLSSHFPNMRTKPIYLKMKNPSIGVYHIEGVPPETKTCKQALNWRIDGNWDEVKQLT